MGLFRRKEKEPEALCSAVIVAAGSSSRMGLDKLLAEVGGLPVLVRCVEAFQQAPSVAEVVVVTREELVPEVARLCQSFQLTKVSKVIRGGENRTQSARLGTLEARQDTPLIAIHDGARPFVPVQVIEDAVAQAAKNGAAAPAVPVKDTIKTVQDGRVTGTPDRDSLRAIQTPQVFDAALLRAALESARTTGEVLTDDCSAVERLGKEIYLTDGSYENIKITTPEDLALAAELLHQREVQS